MLRFGHVDSDYDEGVLVWGSPADLRALELMLRSFANRPGEISLSEAGGIAQTGHRILVRESDDHRTGMMRSPDGFVWHLTPTAAREFADKVAVLLGSSKGGHHYLDGTNDEVTVKVSVHEYPDDFLLSSISIDGK
jgi:hypothetical protein